jgi:hypothetical protein
MAVPCKATRLPGLRKESNLARRRREFYRFPDTPVMRPYDAAVTTTIRRGVIALSITLAALFLIGYLWIMHLGMEEYICFDRHPWWGPPTDPTSECSGLWYADKHPASFPGLFRDSAPGRSRIRDSASPMANQLRCIRRDSGSVRRLRECTHERVGQSAVKPLFVVLGTLPPLMLMLPRYANGSTPRLGRCTARVLYVSKAPGVSYGPHDACD